MIISALLLLFGCSSEEATERERVTAEFLDSLGVDVSSQQWWRTAVTLKINVVTDEPVKLYLLTQQNGRTYLCDRKEVASSRTIAMTAPQGQGNTLYLYYQYKNKLLSQEITLSGNPTEVISLNTTGTRSSRFNAPPASLCRRDAQGRAR